VREEGKKHYQTPLLCPRPFGRCFGSIFSLEPSKKANELSIVAPCLMIRYLKLEEEQVWLETRQVKGRET
jgi:hypothetical protein